MVFHDWTLWPRKPSYDPVFANNTWEQIIAACQANEVPDTCSSGRRTATST